MKCVLLGLLGADRSFSLPLVYDVTKDGHDIKAVCRIKVVVCSDKAHVVLVKGALQKSDLDNITTDAALILDNDGGNITGSDFIQHCIQSGTLERSPSHPVIGEMDNACEAIFERIVFQDAFLVFD